MTATSTPISLVPLGALHDVTLGLSASHSPDVSRLGLMEGHYRLALGEVARSVLVLGGRIAYGGHLDPTGYTAFLSSEVRRFGNRNRPLKVCLAWSEHRRVAISELIAKEAELGLYGSITYLDPIGKVVERDAGRSEAAVPENDPAIVAQGLSSMRLAMQSLISGRLVIGGKRHDFLGDLPGTVEETLLAIDANMPVFLAGGFGGATLDIIEAFAPTDAAWLIRSRVASTDPRMQCGIDRIKKAIPPYAWDRLNNGLTPDENRRLAATHRPSEIATLVSLGLGRRKLLP